MIKYEIQSTQKDTNVYDRLNYDAGQTGKVDKNETLT